MSRTTSAYVKTLQKQFYLDDTDLVRLNQELPELCRDVKGSFLRHCKIGVGVSVKIT